MGRAGVQGATIHATLRRNHGYTGSYSAVRRFVQYMAAQRPLVTTMRLTFLTAEAAQVDFGARPTIVVHTSEVMKTWIVVMTLAFSRHQYAEVVRDQTVATWLACNGCAFEHFGGVPEHIISDNSKCAITRASVTDPVVQRAYAQCAEGYGFRISPYPSADPQKKGIVESGVNFVKSVRVTLRALRDMPDANRQLLERVLCDAGTRCHGMTPEQPLRVFVQTEQALLNPLSDVPPELAVWAQVSVDRHAHVQFYPLRLDKRGDHPVMFAYMLDSNAHRAPGRRFARLAPIPALPLPRFLSQP